MCTRVCACADVAVTGRRLAARRGAEVHGAAVRLQRPSCGVTDRPLVDPRRKDAADRQREDRVSCRAAPVPPRGRRCLSVRTQQGAGPLASSCSILLGGVTLTHRDRPCVSMERFSSCEVRVRRQKPTEVGEVRVDVNVGKRSPFLCVCQVGGPACAALG